MSNPKIRVLLIDDDDYQYLVLQKYLKKIDPQLYELNWVDHYEAALQIIEKQEYDVCLVDYYLDQHNGTEIIRHALDANNKMPMILLTANESKAMDLEAMEAGAVDYLVKGQINPTLLERSLRYAIARKKAEVELAKRNRELQESYRTIREQTKQMHIELEHAKQTQQAILPKQFPEIEGVQLSCKFVPMEKIGGDFYDVFRVDDEHFGLLVADVTGHGISAALISLMIYSIFKDSAVGLASPSIVSNLANARLDGKLPIGKMATMFYAVYHPGDRMLTYVSAGHPPGLVLRPRTQEVIELTSSGMIFGIIPFQVEYEERQFQLETGDKLFLYTDGIFEVVNEDDKMLGAERFQAFLQEHIHLPLSSLLNEVYQYGLNYSGIQGFEDDITFLGLEVI